MGGADGRIHFCPLPLDELLWDIGNLLLLFWWPCPQPSSTRSSKEGQQLVCWASAASSGGFLWLPLAYYLGQVLLILLVMPLSQILQKKYQKMLLSESFRTAFKKYLFSVLFLRKSEIIITGQVNALSMWIFIKVPPPIHTLILHCCRYTFQVTTWSSK